MKSNYMIELGSHRVPPSFSYTSKVAQPDDRLRCYVEEIRAVYEINRSIIERPDLTSLLEFIVGKAKELTGADVAYYGFIEGNVIRRQTFLGERTDEFRNIELLEGSGLGWLAMEEGAPVAVEDFFTDKRLKQAPYDAVRNEGLISFLAVPFFSGRGEPLGVLYVANRRKTRFTGEQVRILVTLGVQTSVAVEHAKLFEEMKKAYGALKTLDELKSSIISNVSHELRTPITRSKSAMELAMTEERTETRNGPLKTALDAITRQNMIVGDLLDATSIAKGETKFKFMAKNIAHEIAPVGGEFKPLLIKGKLKMKVNIEDGIPEVKADHKQQLHVLRNLHT